MRAGRMDRVVTLRQSTVTQDSYGQPIETWTDLDRVWAARIEKTGAERWQSKQIVSEQSVKYQIRYRDDVTVFLRVLDGSTEYEINAVVELGRRSGLELLATVTEG